MNNIKIKNLKKIKKLLLQIDQKELNLLSNELTEIELLNPDEDIINALKTIINKNTIERLDLNL